MSILRETIMAVCAVTALFQTTGVAAKPPALKVDSAESSFQFKAIGKPSFIKITGGSKGLSGSISFDESGETASGKVLLELGNIKTGIELRDDHLRENYLEVEKYPQAKLLFSKVPISAKKFKGQLTLHGQTNDIEIELAKPVEINQSAKAEAKFAIQLDQYGIRIPSFKGITVASKVEILINLSMVSSLLENEVSEK